MERFLEPERAQRSVVLRSMIEILGMENVSGGTDFPVNTIDPFLNMYIVVTRKDSRGAVYGPGIGSRASRRCGCIRPRGRIARSRRS